MKRIEILGASGVGKTTLFDKLCSLNEDKVFFCLPDAFKTSAKNSKQAKGLKKKILLYLLKNNLAFGNELKYSKYILYTSEKSLISKFGNNYFKSFDILYDNLKKSNSVEKRIKYLNDFISKIKDIELLEKNLINNDYVLFDEGILHKLPGINTSIFDIYSKAELKKDKAFDISAIIYCELSPDIVFKQALKRKNEGKASFSHKNLSEHELESFVNKNIESVKKAISFYEELEIPILKINTNDDLNYNFNIINDFILSLKNVN